MKSKLTIIIPTHNRPVLFKRCLNSALKNKPENVEILVNNDSSDIEEIQHPNVKYYYKKYDNFFNCFLFLISKVKTEYFYILEDDDILSHTFYNNLNFLDGKNDLIKGFYVTCETYKTFLKRIVRDDGFRWFQFSQIIFKTSIFDVPKLEFKCSPCIHLDWYIYQHLSKKYKVLKTKNIFFIQTCDGEDNVSFPEFSNLEKCKFCKFSYMKND